MNREKIYREPDIINVIYDDIVNDLYSFNGDKPVSDRIRLMKFNSACEYLLESDIDIIDIANRLNIDNIEIFNSFFEELSGVKPEVFRRRFRLD